MSMVKAFNRSEIQSDTVLSSTVGAIVEITEQGVVTVDFAENTGLPIMVRSILSHVNVDDLKGQSVKVLLVFENSDIRKPIIAGIINNIVFTPKVDLVDEVRTNKNEKHDVTGVSSKSESVDAVIDGKKIVFNANEEILLRCGKSSILLRKDGKIVIKGSNLISRSSSTNKIKGSSVSIN